MARDPSSTVEPMGDEAHPLGDRDGGTDDALIGASEPLKVVPISQSASAREYSKEPNYTQHGVGELSNITQIPDITD